MSKQKGFSKIAIIIILIFVVIAIGFIKYFNLYEKISDKVVPINTKDFGDTGIIFISPEHNQTIFSPLKITGYIDDFGDGWEADFGSVELIDGNGGKMTSAQLRVDATDDEGNYKERPYYFESTLVFNEPQTTEGSLIFYEHTARGDMTEKFRLPIKFDKNNINSSMFEYMETFTSKELGILLKYPKEWGVMEEKMKGMPLLGDLAFGFSWKNANTGYDYDPDIEFGIVGGVFPAWEFLPPLLIYYKGEPVDDACQKNAYLDNLLEKINLPAAEKIHTINLKDCKIIKINNKLSVAVFSGTYASNYKMVDEPYYDIAIVVPEQRTFYNFKGAIMQTQSQKYPGLKIWIDERFLRNNTDFKEQEKVFDNIINSLLLI